MIFSRLMNNAPSDEHRQSLTLIRFRPSSQPVNALANMATRSEGRERVSSRASRSHLATRRQPVLDDLRFAWLR